MKRRSSARASCWAAGRPWSDRLRLALSDGDCTFCKIIQGQVPAQKIDEDDRSVAFMDISPATRGHALVVPRRHARDLLEIEPAELEAVITATQRLAGRVRERLKPDGINLLNSCGRAAWQTVFHFHIHVIPRYEDDPLQLPWTPREGDPDEIAKVAEQLR
jgi:histidine triad (HIT) family protein